MKEPRQSQLKYKMLTIRLIKGGKIASWLNNVNYKMHLQLFPACV